MSELNMARLATVIQLVGIVEGSHVVAKLEPKGIEIVNAVAYHTFEELLVPVCYEGDVFIEINKRGHHKFIRHVEAEPQRIIVNQPMVAPEYTWLEVHGIPAGIDCTVVLEEKTRGPLVTTYQSRKNTGLKVIYTDTVSDGIYRKKLRVPELGMEVRVRVYGEKIYENRADMNIHRLGDDNVNILVLQVRKR